jgi:hypothetical protein
MVKLLRALLVSDQSYATSLPVMRSMVIRLTLVVASVIALGIAVARAVGPPTPGGAAATQLFSERLEHAVPTPGRGCPVTGDLVGDANPAEVASALCGGN